MFALQLVQIGEDVGVILPEEVLARLQWGKDDELLLTETASEITLIRCDPSPEHQFELNQ